MIHILNIGHIFKSGKNIKFIYYLKNYFRLIIPSYFYRFRLNAILKDAQKRNDFDYIQRRVDYYNQLSSKTDIDKELFAAESISLKEQKICGPKVYYFDSMQYGRYFPKANKWKLLPGDITHVPNIPTIVKSRPLTDNNVNSILMKLDKIRHFIYVKDNISFEQKQNKIIFRGKIGEPNRASFKENRYRFLEMYWNNPICDLGEIKSNNCNIKWCKDKKTIKEHLNYKFILSLEGNDVASNLKWVMSSNSLAVMPRPTCETWFMEGTLIPNFHYVEIKPDFSDLEERLQFYIEHPEEANKIINNANAYVSQFKDSKREDIISLLTLKKYFEETDINSTV